MLLLSFRESASVKANLTFHKFDVCLIIFAEVSIGNHYLTNVAHEYGSGLLSTDCLIVYERNII